MTHHSIKTIERELAANTIELRTLLGPEKPPNELMDTEPAANEDQSMKMSSGSILNEQEYLNKIAVLFPSDTEREFPAYDENPEAYEHTRQLFAFWKHYRARRETETRPYYTDEEFELALHIVNGVGTTMKHMAYVLFPEPWGRRGRTGGQRPTDPQIESSIRSVINMARYVNIHNRQ